MMPIPARQYVRAVARQDARAVACFFAASSGSWCVC